MLRPAGKTAKRGLRTATRGLWTGQNGETAKRLKRQNGKTQNGETAKRQNGTQKGKTVQNATLRSVALARLEVLRTCFRTLRARGPVPDKAHVPGLKAPNAAFA